MCVDNDIAGKEFCKKLDRFMIKDNEGKSYQIKKELPNIPRDSVQKWDWNDQRKHEIKISESLKQAKYRLLMGLER